MSEHDSELSGEDGEELFLLMRLLQTPHLLLLPTDEAEIKIYIRSNSTSAMKYRDLTLSNLND